MRRKIKEVVVFGQGTRYSTNDFAVEYSLHQQRVQRATTLYRTYRQYKAAAKATVVAAERLARRTRQVSYWEYLWDKRSNNPSEPVYSTDSLGVLFGSVVLLNSLRDQAKVALNTFLDSVPNKSEVMQEVVASLDQ